MKVQFGEGDEVDGTAEVAPDGTIRVTGENARAIRGVIDHHAESLVEKLMREGQADPDPSAEDVLRFVVERMRGRRSWAREVTEGQADEGASR